MKWLRTIAHEVLGLFVDDGSFAVAIVVWLVILKMLILHSTHAAHGGGFILFGGLAAILAQSVLRAGRKPAS